MAKRKQPKPPKQKTYFINVHSSKAPNILTAVNKTGTLEDAKAVSRSLWKIAGAPYVARIIDENATELFLYKV